MLSTNGVSPQSARMVETAARTVFWFGASTVEQRWPARFLRILSKRPTFVVKNTLLRLTWPWPTASFMLRLPRTISWEAARTNWQKVPPRFNTRGIVSGLSDGRDKGQAALPWGFIHPGPSLECSKMEWV